MNLFYQNQFESLKGKIFDYLRILQSTSNDLLMKYKQSFEENSIYQHLEIAELSDDLLSILEDHFFFGAQKIKQA